jgi:hypothetical protein
MAFPREVYLDEAIEQTLRSHLDDVLYKHDSERGPYLDDLIAMQHEYWAEPAEEVMTFPFQGAANIVVPLEAIAVEANHSRVMTTLFGLEQFISCKSVDPRFEATEQPLELFLDKEFKDNIRIREPITSIALEWGKFGNGIAKCGYVREVKYAIRELEDGKEEEVEIVTKQGACVEAVPLSRFLMPYADLNTDSARWCGEEHSETPHDIQIMEDSGLFRKGTYEKLRQWVSNIDTMGNPMKFEESQAELEKRSIVWPARINWVELWLAWNVDGNEDGKYKELVIHYHRESGTFMSIRYNWDRKVRRPYEIGYFFPLENRWTALGLCKQTRQFQAEVTAKHRQLLDNATMANMRMIKVSRMSGYQPGEPIYPGKMWIVDDMTHIDSVEMGEVYPSGYNTEQAPLLYYQQRTGVNDLTLGMPQQGTPGTATSDLARVQEGSKKFGYTYANFKDLNDRIVKKTISNIRQFGPRNVKYYQYGDGGSLVEQFFMEDQEAIDEGMLMDIRTAGQLDNKIIDRQNWLQIAPTYQNYAQSMLQLLGQMQQPQLVAEAVRQLTNGAHEIMRQILESFDVRNIDRMLITLPQNVNQPVPQQIGAGSTQGPNGAAGMGDINSLLASIQGGSA